MPRTSIYTRDIPRLRKLQSEAKSLWYKRFGESLSYGSLIEIALAHLGDSLRSGLDNDNTGQDLHKYIRTGLQGK